MTNISAMLDSYEDFYLIGRVLLRYRRYNVILYSHTNVTIVAVEQILRMQSTASYAYENIIFSHIFIIRRHQCECKSTTFCNETCRLKLRKLSRATVQAVVRFPVPMPMLGARRRHP